MFVVNCRQVGCPEEDGKQPSLLRLTYPSSANRHYVWEQNAHGHGLITTWAATNRYQRGKQALTLSLPGTRENQSHPHPFPIGKAVLLRALKNGLAFWLWLWFLGLGLGFFVRLFVLFGFACLFDILKENKRKDEVGNKPNFRESPSISIAIGLQLQWALFRPDRRTWWKWGYSPFQNFPSWYPDGRSNSVNFAYVEAAAYREEARQDGGM